MPTIRPLSPWQQLSNKIIQVPAAPTPAASTNMLVNVAFPPGHMAGQAQGTTSVANPIVFACQSRRFQRDFEIVADPEDRFEDFQASVRHSFLALASATLRGGRDFVPRSLFGAPIRVSGAAVPLTASATIGAASAAVITEPPGTTPGVLPGAPPLFDSMISANSSPSNPALSTLLLTNVLTKNNTGTVLLVPEVRYTLQLETSVIVFLSAPVATAGVALALPGVPRNAFATGSVNVGWPNPPRSLPGAGAFVEFQFPRRVPLGSLFGLGLPGLEDGNQIVDENGEPVGDSGG